MDTNVVAYLFLQGDQTSKAQALLALDSDWRSEDFLLVEFTNILTTFLRSGDLDAKTAKRILLNAIELMGPGLQRVTHQEAFETAMQARVSAYDGRFLALAQTLGTRLVTEDQKLRKAAPELTSSLDEALRQR